MTPLQVDPDSVCHEGSKPYEVKDYNCVVYFWNQHGVSGVCLPKFTPITPDVLLQDQMRK